MWWRLDAVWSPAFATAGCNSTAAFLDSFMERPSDRAASEIVPVESVCRTAAAKFRLLWAMLVNPRALDRARSRQLRPIAAIEARLLI